MTTRPGYYDPDEFLWTWEFQEIIRLRRIWERKIDEDTVVIVDPPAHRTDVDTRPGVTSMIVRQCTVMKSSVAGFTEASLNGVRYAAKHDPQNVGFAIDNRVEAGNINEIRLQPTLRNLGETIFTDNTDDAGKFLLKLRRMLVYFLGSYSPGAFANKMLELAISDEREEHAKTAGDTSTTENLRSRVKSSPRGLLIEMSKPKMAGGPIDAEHKKGSMHVPEIPCPHCTSANGGQPAGYQELLQDNMKFGWCKNESTGEWDLDRVLREADFECVHCKKLLQVERNKRWMNDRTRRRWRRTNFAAEPYHISFQISDFYSYLITIGELAVKYIKTKGDPVARQGYRNHHEGLPYELRETKTEISDLLLLRGDYTRGIMPWLPRALVLGSDVGLLDVHWVVIAIRSTPEFDGEAAIIDYGKELHPTDVLRIFKERKYRCEEDGKDYPVTVGAMDEKYRKLDVQAACFKSPGWMLKPTAGIAAELSIRSIAFTQHPQAPAGFGIISYVDRDAKHDLYTARIGSWANWHRAGRPRLTDLKPEERPIGSPIHFFKDLNDHPQSPHAKFIEQFTKEHLIEIPGAHSAKQFVWKRKGPNHWGDATKVALVIWRYFQSS